MSPDQLFQLSSTFVLPGWLALAFAPFAPRLADLLATILVPLLLSLVYAGLVLAFWAGASGGLGSLTQVMQLFDQPEIALAGWVHYLAFDLFVGAWIVRTARVEDINHLFVLPCLVLTFLFGPAGFLAFSALRVTLTGRSLA